MEAHEGDSLKRWVESKMQITKFLRKTGFKRNWLYDQFKKSKLREMDKARIHDTILNNLANDLRDLPSIEELFLCQGKSSSGHEVYFSDKSEEEETTSLTKSDIIKLQTENKLMKDELKFLRGAFSKLLTKHGEEETEDKSSI